MWIRSQHGKFFKDCDYFEVEKFHEQYSVCTLSNRSDISVALGIYSSEKKDLKVLDAIQKSKDGVETEIKKQISFYSTLEGSLQGYSNCRMADLVSNVDLDLKQVKQAIDDLKSEIKAYE